MKMKRTLLPSTPGHLELLPNELLLQIAAHLSSVDILQALSGLSHRFNSIITQSVRHVTVAEGTSKRRFDELIFDVRDIVETMYFDGKLAPQAFPSTYAFLNLRSVIFRHSPDDYVKLKVNGASANEAILSCLEVFRTCHIWNVDDNDDSERDTHQTKVTVTTPCCTAIVRLSLHMCSERDLLTLCVLAPKLSYLRVHELISSNDDSNLDAILTSMSVHTQLKRLHIACNANRLNGIHWIGKLMAHCHSSLKCLSLDISLNSHIDGYHLQSILEPCRYLERVTFSFNYWLEPDEEMNVLHSLQTDWWLDSRRPPVLVMCNGHSQAFILSMPCRLNDYAWFPVDPSDWTVNKGPLDAPEICFTKQTSIRFANIKGRLITLDLVRIVAHVFRASNQELSISHWGFVSPDLLIEQLVNTKSQNPRLSRVTFFDLRSCDLDRLDPKTLLIWVLLAPNIRVLNLCQGTVSAKIRLANRLTAALDDDERLRSVVQSVDEVHVFYMTDPLNYVTKQHVCQMYSNIFRKPLIR